ncbi:MAG: ParB N-terminal domain-containing protein, partial [Pseudomonadota bacterium]
VRAALRDGGRRARAVLTRGMAPSPSAPGPDVSGPDVPESDVSGPDVSGPDVSGTPAADPHAPASDASADDAPPSVPAAPPPLARAPRLQRIATREDLDDIRFVDGIALVEVDAALLARIRFKNDHRGDDSRLKRLRESIRRDGYSNWQPITARIGQKGKWVIVDGGHRLTAIRDVMGDWWANLFGRKVRSVQFVLMIGPRSWRKARAVTNSARRARAEAAKAGPKPRRRKTGGREGRG